MITIYTDGATNVKTGESGAGIYIKADKKIYEHKFPLGKMSNHEAEFHAVIHALKISNDSFLNEIISLKTDSQIVVDSCEKNFVKNKAYKPLLGEINHLAKSHPYFFVKWIPSKDNFHADRLAREAIGLNGLK